MKLLSCLAAFALLLCGPASSQLAAQAASIEASMGIGTGLGGPEARHRTGMAMDALVGVRVRDLSHGALVAGLAIGAQGAASRTDDCILTPGGGCLPSFPFLVWVGPLAGWQSPRGRLRVLAGAASFQADEGGSTAGITARADAAVRALPHLAPVVSVRGAILPSYQGDMIGLLSVGVGLRIH